MKDFGTVSDVLNYAIDREKEAVAFYEELAKIMERPNMKKVFENFSREESSHRDKLETVRDKGLVLHGKESVTDLKISDYLVEHEPSASMDYQDALVLAMKREKASYRLYLDLAAASQDESAQETFRYLATEEAKHKLRFEIEYDDIVLNED